MRPCPRCRGDGEVTDKLECAPGAGIQWERSTAVKLTVGVILFIVAVVIFLVAAIGVKLGTIDLLALGLAALAAGFVLDRWKM